MPNGEGKWALIEGSKRTLADVRALAPAAVGAAQLRLRFADALAAPPNLVDRTLTTLTRDALARHAPCD